MSSSASRTRSNTTSYLIFAPSQHQKHKLKIPPRAETAWTDFSLGNFPSFACGRAKWQMSKNRLPGHVHPLLPSPCPSSSADFEDVQSLSDQGRKSSAGIIHTVSSQSSFIFPSVFDESQSNKWILNLNAEEEEGVEKRQGMGNVADRAGTSERPERFSPVLPNEHLFPQELLGSG